MGMSIILDWFSTYKYWLVSYRYQQKSDTSITGFGYRLVKLKMPPTLDDIHNSLGPEPVTVIIVNYQRLTKAEHKALSIRTEKDIEI